jgi:tripartite-type tricarboxylate transporter receptor subunit TctC
MIGEASHLRRGKMNLRLVAMTIAIAAGAPLAHAAEWPNRPIHFIVPFPAGGSTDVAARLVADYVSRSLGQPVVVEDKSGANGNIGTEYAIKSAPDGYTVLVALDSVSTNPHIYRLNFDPMRSLVPVVEVSHQPVVLAAHRSLGVGTLAQLTAKLKQQPGMRFGTGSGVGSLQALTALWYAKLAGITLVQVPYRGGGPAINDLIAGTVQLGSLGSTPLMPYYKSGTLQMLAQSGSARSPTLPDVPTFQESGFPDLVIEQRVGILVPKGTSAEIVGRLNSEVNAALRDEKLQKLLTDQAQDAAGGTPERYGALLQSDSDLVSGLVKELNVEIQ